MNNLYLFPIPNPDKPCPVFPIRVPKNLKVLCCPRSYRINCLMFIFQSGRHRPQLNVQSMLRPARGIPVRLLFFFECSATHNLYITETDIRMWVRMERAERGKDSDSGTGIIAWIKALFTSGSIGNVDFLSTHPASGKRIKVNLSTPPYCIALVRCRGTNENITLVL